MNSRRRVNSNVGLLLILFSLDDVEARTLEGCRRRNNILNTRSVLPVGAVMMLGNRLVPQRN